MLKFISREKLIKSDGHVIWYDLVIDTETQVEYFIMNNNIIPRFKMINEKTLGVITRGSQG